MSLAGDVRVPNRVDAVVDAMQPSARDAALDHAVGQSDSEELRYRHHTVLTGSEGGDREVETTSLRAIGMTCTYAVDFLPDAGHGAIVRGRGARINASV
jgi:16S rRNA U1498 N3-methylase RsmE